MTRVAGQFVFTSGQDHEIMTVGIKASEVITAGLGVSFDANGNAQAVGVADDLRAVGYGIALETKTGSLVEGEVKVQVAIGNTYIYGVAGDGNIKPQIGLVFDAAGKLVPQAAVAVYATQAGRYILQEGEEAGATDPITDAVIGVRLGAD